LVFAVVLNDGRIFASRAVQAWSARTLINVDFTCRTIKATNTAAGKSVCCGNAHTRHTAYVARGRVTVLAGKHPHGRARKLATWVATNSAIVTRGTSTFVYIHGTPVTTEAWYTLAFVGSTTVAIGFCTVPTVPARSRETFVNVNVTRVSQEALPTYTGEAATGPFDTCAAVDAGMRSTFVDVTLAQGTFKTSSTIAREITEATFWAGGAISTQR
jgi:hypothetical protein